MNPRKFLLLNTLLSLPGIGATFTVLFIVFGLRPPIFNLLVSMGILSERSFSEGSGVVLLLPIIFGSLVHIPFLVVAWFLWRKSGFVTLNRTFKILFLILTIVLLTFWVQLLANQ